MHNALWNASTYLFTRTRYFAFVYVLSSPGNNFIPVCRMKFLLSFIIENPHPLREWRIYKDSTCARLCPTLRSSILWCAVAPPRLSFICPGTSLDDVENVAHRAFHYLTICKHTSRATQKCLVLRTRKLMTRAIDTAPDDGTEIRPSEESRASVCRELWIDTDETSRVRRERETRAIKSGVRLIANFRAIRSSRNYPPPDGDLEYSLKNSVRGRAHRR